MEWEDTEKGKEWTKNYHKQYYLDNKDRYRKQQRAYFNDPKVRKRKNYLDRKRDADAKVTIYNILGGPVCNHCGQTDIRVLQLDHINGGGSRDRKTNRSTSKIVRIYKDDLSKLKEIYQILCANCNWIKKHDNNETAYR